MNTTMRYGARQTELNWLGAAFSAHYRRRVRDAGVYWTARQLRKQGIPLVVTLVMLTRGTK